MNIVFYRKVQLCIMSRGISSLRCVLYVLYVSDVVVNTCAEDGRLELKIALRSKSRPNVLFSRRQCSVIERNPTQYESKLWRRNGGGILQ